MPRTEVAAAFETCRVILDRPRQGDPFSLVYLAERTDASSQNVIAMSPAFRADLDYGSHRAALMAIQTQLQSDGWERQPRAKLDALRVVFRRPR